MDGGASRATVQGFTKSQTQLNDFHFRFLSLLDRSSHNLPHCDLHLQFIHQWPLCGRMEQVYSTIVLYQKPSKDTAPSLTSSDFFFYRSCSYITQIPNYQHPVTY